MGEADYAAVPYTWGALESAGKQRREGAQEKGDNHGTSRIRTRHEVPGEEKESNWLPAPEGPFYLVLRMYQPHQEVIDATWAAPRVEKVG